MSSNKLDTIELKVALLLRLGVLVSGSLLLLAILLRLFGFEFWQPIAGAGLWALVVLPILRVFITGLVFVLERDFAMFGLAFGVLFLLGVSLILGWGVH